jgi:hypothetical protein
MSGESAPQILGRAPSQASPRSRTTCVLDRPPQASSMRLQKLGAPRPPIWELGHLSGAGGGDRRRLGRFMQTLTSD